MSQSLTDWLQTSRMVVVAVDKDRGTLRVRADGGGCHDLSCRETTVVVDDGGGPGGLQALNPGDIIKLDPAPESPEHPQRIVVVRRAWDELTSPEF